MKRYLVLFLLWCGGGSLFAQTSIFDALTIYEPGKGTVTIHQSAVIRSLVGRQSVEDKTVTEGDNSYLLMPGFRVQVFSGNNQRTSMDEAHSKKTQIENLFSQITAHVTYTAPFWRLHVGDYLSYEEAFSMQCKLGEAFPSFKKEIQIVREEVRIPLN